MHSELYTDGIEEITVSGSIVRVDLVSLSPTERDANNAQKRVFRQRLIFSVESFANSVDVMQNALQGLVDAGVIRRNQPRASAEVSECFKQFPLKKMVRWQERKLRRIRLPARCLGQRWIVFPRSRPITA
jgi:hypothetical protein